MTNPDSIDKPKRNGISNRIIDAFSKIALPIAIIYFGWTQHQTTTDFNKSKLDKEIMLKFIDISWNSLNSNDTTEIKNAIRLISTIDPKYSLQLLDVLSLDSMRTSFIKKEVKELSLRAQESVIEGMQIEIHYTKNEFESLSNSMKSALTDETRLNFSNVDLVAKYRLESMVCNNEIVYSNDTDYQKVRALQSFLNNLMVERTFDIRKQKSMLKEKTIINVCK